MKKHYIFTLFSLLFIISGHATIHIIDIPADGSNTYSPANINVILGDTIRFTGSPYHPTTHVSEATWNANGITPAESAQFESISAIYEFVPSELGTLFYVCDLHVSMGMKGSINVENTSDINTEFQGEISVKLGQVPVKNNSLNYAISSSVSSPKAFSVYNTSGQKVLETAVTTNIGKLEMNLPYGMYVLILKDRNDLILFRESLLVE